MGNDATNESINFEEGEVLNNNASVVHQSYEEEGAIHRNRNYMLINNSNLENGEEVQAPV